MPLHPDAKKFLDARVAAGSRPVNELTPAQAREQAIRLNALNGAGQPVAQVQDRFIHANGVDIPVRVYTPQGNAPFPILVYFHGGGWVVGNLDTTDVLCRALANAAGGVLVSVNYRHAPEDKFPAASDDAYAATRYVSEHAAEFGGNERRIAVGGASAGGNLAAVVALMARDQGAPKLALQYLQVPVVSANFNTASYLENAEGYGLTRDAMIWFWKNYLRNEGDAQNPYASPARGNLRGVAPALVITSEFDPLRDEGVAYAAQLKAAGVPTTHIHRPGMVHAFLGTDMASIVAEELRKAFG